MPKNKLVRISGSLVVLAWVTYKLDWVQLRESIWAMDFKYWFLAAVIYSLTQVASAWRWQLLSRPLGFSTRLVAYVHHYFVGMCFNLFLPTSVGGDVVRALYLDPKGQNRAAAFVSVFVDRFSGLLVLLLLACLATIGIPRGLPPWVAMSVWASTGLTALAMLLLPVVSGYASRLRKTKQFVDAFWGYRDNPRLLLQAMALSFVVQAANVAVVALLGRGMGLAIPWTYYAILVPMVTLLTLAPISLNGMGVREGGTALFLAPMGISFSSSICLGFLWFSVFTAISLLGAAVFLVDTILEREEREDGPIRDHSHQGRTGQSKAAA